MTDWLVKDFHVLYLAAEAALAQAVLDGYKCAHLNDLARQLCRLRAAFEACERGRESGTPERLNEAERKALNALHRWLHSQVGDDALIEDAQDFHEMMHTQDAHDCDRLEEEERIAWANAQRETGEADAAPKPLREVQGRPWELLERAGNQLFYGNPEGRAGDSMFRAVCVAGTVIVKNIEGELPMAFGAFNGAADHPRSSLVLAAKLREVAADIEARVSAL